MTRLTSYIKRHKHISVNKLDDIFDHIFDNIRLSSPDNMINRLVFR